MAGKRSWGGWEWGLGSKQQKGPRHASGLRGWGTLPESPAGFLGPSGWDKRPLLLSHSSGPGGPLLPASPILPQPPSYVPSTNTASRGPLRV